ncbi:NlpC/P60 family protein [Clostridium sporogenes]|uniref:NlpC/P60 family protein n=1 Tax=Clostridium sporogenes TaxID=1509 RepID=UPI002237898E|nr:NlpC/P60 family protein [Clostridium sporogenes]MCW6088798.1 C40 family peptidase [Clostridium sporogenes]
MKKKTTILSIFLAVFMALTLNVANVKASTTGKEIVEYAKRFLGTPYATNGTTPSGFDCSGFVQYVYRNCAGINLPRDTYGQINAGTRVSQSQLQPGDLVFPHTGHVGIYVGNGQMIHSPQTGDVVKISSVYKFYAGVRIKGITQCPFVQPADGNARPIKSRYMLVTGSQVVRSAPCDSAQVVRTLKHGDVIDIYKVYQNNGEWSLIARGVNQQWIRSTYLAPQVPVVDDGNARPIKTRYKVIVSSVQVRSYPNSSSPVVRTLKKGDVIDIYAEHGDWYLIARGVNQQWVPKNTLSK